MDHKLASVASRFKSLSSLHSSKKRASRLLRFSFKPTNQNYWLQNTRHTVAYRQSAIKSHFPQGRSSIPSQNTGGASFPHAFCDYINDRISRLRHACDSTQHAVCAAPFLVLHSHAQAMHILPERRFTLSLDGSSSLKRQVT